MRRTDEHKAMTPDAVKVVQPLLTPSEVAEASHRPEDGWREVHNRMGQRTGWYRPSDGLHDDPAFIVTPEPDPTTAAIFADEELQRLADERDAVAEKHRIAYEAFEANHFAITKLTYDIEHTPSNMIYPSKADMLNGRNGKLDTSRQERLNALKQRHRELKREEEEAAVAFQRAGGRYHRRFQDVQNTIRAWPTIER